MEFAGSAEDLLFLYGPVDACEGSCGSHAEPVANWLDEGAPFACSPPAYTTAGQANHCHTTAPPLYLLVAYSDLLALLLQLPGTWDGRAQAKRNVEVQ